MLVDITHFFFVIFIHFCSIQTFDELRMFQSFFPCQSTQENALPCNTCSLKPGCEILPTYMTKPYYMPVQFSLSLLTRITSFCSFHPIYVVPPYHSKERTVSPLKPRHSGTNFSSCQRVTQPFEISPMSVVFYLAVNTASVSLCKRGAVYSGTHKDIVRFWPT